MEIYLVGGAVRDELLGLLPKEKDWVVVGSTPEEMKALGFRQVGRGFPVFLHPQTQEEYALARTERKTGPGYTQFACYLDPSVTLEADLKRRDLTINAIAKTVDGKIIDPYGGQKDLENKVLRHVSEAFIEDPVRVLRLARFAARYASKGFSIAPETMQLLREMVYLGEIDALIPERVWQELLRALSEANPEVFFMVLRNCGALRVLFPELDRLFGVPNSLRWHPEIDTGVHTLLVLQAACRLSNDSRVRFAALLHDIGKGLTPWDKWPHHFGHEKKGVAAMRVLCKRYRVPKDYAILSFFVGRYHGLSHKVFDLKATTLVKFLRKIDALRKPQRFEQFLLACEADFHGRPGYEDLPYKHADFLRKTLKVVNQVSVAPLLAKGLTGPALVAAIYQAQVCAVKGYLDSVN